MKKDRLVRVDERLAMDASSMYKYIKYGFVESFERYLLMRKSASVIWTIDENSPTDWNTRYLYADLSHDQPIHRRSTGLTLGRWVHYRQWWFLCLRWILRFMVTELVRSEVQRLSVKLCREWIPAFILSGGKWIYHDQEIPLSVWVSRDEERLTVRRNLSVGSPSSLRCFMIRSVATTHLYTAFVEKEAQEWVMIEGETTDSWLSRFISQQSWLKQFHIHSTPSLSKACNHLYTIDRIIYRILLNATSVGPPMEHI